MAFYSINLRNAALANGMDALKRYNVNGNIQDHSPEYWSQVRDKTYLGTPVFAPLEIKGGSYQVEGGGTVEFEGIFIDTVIISVTQSKIIEKTSITGRAGTVKEYIADGDYAVNMKIVLASPHANIFPEEANGRLLAILKAPVPLEVVCPFLTPYEIFNITVDSYSNGQKAGYQNVVEFDVNCSSDAPLELQIARQ